MAEPTFIIDDKTFMVVQRMMDDLGVTAPAEVIRRAIALLKFAIDNEKKGYTIAAVKDTEIMETIRIR